MKEHNRIHCSVKLLATFRYIWYEINVQVKIVYRFILKNSITHIIVATSMVFSSEVVWVFWERLALHLNFSSRWQTVENLNVSDKLTFLFCHSSLVQNHSQTLKLIFWTSISPRSANQQDSMQLVDIRILTISPTGILVKNHIAYHSFKTYEYQFKVGQAFPAHLHSKDILSATITLTYRIRISLISVIVFIHIRNTTDK